MTGYRNIQDGGQATGNTLSTMIPKTGFECIRRDIVNRKILDMGIAMSLYGADETVNLRVKQDGDALGDGECNMAGLESAINTKVAAGIKCINVLFDKGVYFFNDSHLGRGAQINIDNNVNLPQVEIHFLGNGSKIIGSKNQLVADVTPEFGLYKYSVCIEDVYNHLLVDGNGSFLSDFYGPLHEMRSLVEVTDSAYGNVDNAVWTDEYVANPTMMRISNVLGHTFSCYYNCGTHHSADTFIQIYSGYCSQIFRVIQCTGEYIIAEATPVESGNYPTMSYSWYNCWPQNLHHCASGEKIMPFFRMINDPVECPSAYYRRIDADSGILFVQTDDAHLCDSTCFFKVEHQMKGVSFSDFKFVGNKAVDEDNAYLIHVSCSNAQSAAGWVNIHDCEFEYIRGTIFRANEMATVYYQHNLCRHYYKKCVSCNLSTDIHILHNSFIEGNLRQTGDAAVVCYNSGYHIAHNRFMNYGYAGILVGLHYVSQIPLMQNVGIIEYNELFMSPGHRDRSSWVPLMDNGAVYVAPRNYLVIIRYNFISGHSGPFKNRGIYCPDGAMNVWIYGNMILNGRNTYAVDLKNSELISNYSNTNNRILYNIIDGCYQFDGCLRDVGTNPDLEKMNVKGRNLILYEHESPLPYNSINFINDSKKENDCYVEACRVEDHGVGLPYIDGTDSWKNAIIVAFELPEFIHSRIRDAYF